MSWKWRILFLAALVIVATVGFFYRDVVANSLTVAPSASGVSTVPTATVKRGDVTLTVSARGELQGGNSEMLTAPMTGENQMAITLLKNPGDVVNAGDVVAQLDITEQTFRLKEAEADLAETDQHLAQATAAAKAKEEEDRYAVLQAKSELRLAELEMRRNPLLATIVAKQNELALESARSRLEQIQQDQGNRKATSRAGIMIQEAARNKAKVKADVARQNIEKMTLRAKSNGYVAVQPNTNGPIFGGSLLPILHVGDTVRPGMGVAQIPDLKNWEMTARIGELDRGHLAVGQKAEIKVVALPAKTFAGRIKEVGAVTGPPWNRIFDCKITVDEPSPELRPGMSSTIVITIDVLKNVLWAPAPALFESDGRSFVYLQTPEGFRPHDVKLVRRSESQVIIEGLPQGSAVALASPDQQTSKKKAGEAGSALKAISK